MKDMTAREYSELVENDSEERYSVDFTYYADDERNMGADLDTECKRWKTAVRRFFKRVAASKMDEAEKEAILGWQETIVESCESGTFEDAERIDGKATGGWAYGVEQTEDGRWYVYVKVRKETAEAAETEQDSRQETASVDDAAEAYREEKELQALPAREFKYYMDERPVSPGAQPRGFTRFDEADPGARYGAIYYGHRLSKKEISDYELRPAEPDPKERKGVRYGALWDKQKQAKAA